MNVFRGMVAGMLAGAAASWVMTTLGDVSQGQAKRQRRPNEGSEESDRAQRDTPGRGSQAQANENGGGVAVQNATVATAQVISQKAIGRELTPDEQKIAGPAVHYAFGSLVGALYGGLAEVIPSAGMGFGMPFGAALWLLGDEVAVPALGLGKGPTEVSPDVHADALANHFCYGITTDILRRILRHVV